MRNQKLYESVGRYLDKYYIDKPDDIKMDISDRMEIFQRRRLWICAITSLEQVQEIYQRN